MRNGYGAIPDVAKTESEHSLSPQDKYPEASEAEAELLGLLDEFISESEISVKLPSVTKYDFETSSSIGFIGSIAPSTIFFLVGLGFALLENGSISSVIGVYFPFVVALIGFFCVTIPAKTRFRQYSKSISAKVDLTKQVAVKNVEDVATSVSSKVDLVKMKLCTVVVEMRPKLEAAAEQETKLKQMDPNIRIPDPNDVVAELDGAKGEISESIRMVEDILPVTSWIPEYLYTPKLHEKRMANKTLPLFLILQLALSYAVYSTLEGTRSVTGARSLNNRQGFITITARAHANILGLSQSDADEMILSMDACWPYPMGIILAVYILSICQIILIFTMTRVSSAVAQVNQVRETVTEKTNHVLRQQGIVFLCKDILEFRMSRVRSKLLTMISLLFKLDMLMSIVTTSNEAISTPVAPSPSTTPVSSPSRRSLSKLFRNTP